MTLAELSLVHEQLRQCALQIENLAREKERRRIARDLHDSLGHALTALNVQLQTAVKLWKLDPAKAELFLTQAQRLGSTAIQEVRLSVSSLRTVAADPPLEAQIESLVEDFQQVNDVVVTTHIDPPVAMPQVVTTTLYRIVQEALTNICKYAAATAVQVQLNPTPDGVQLTVIDNGVGFSLDANSAGFGLQGMAERVAALGGQLRIKTQPESGCRIQVELPAQGQGSITEEPPVSFDFFSALTAAEPLTCLVLPPKQLSQLETVLAEYIGLIAPALIQQVMAQVSSCQALVEQLTLHIPTSQRTKFQQRVTFLLDLSPIQPRTSAHLPDSSGQVMNESFIYQCEEALVDATGPIAPLIMQQVLESCPQSLSELVEMLVEKIPDTQAAVEFQQRLSAWSQN